MNKLSWNPGSVIKIHHVNIGLLVVEHTNTHAHTHTHTHTEIKIDKNNQT